MKINGITTLFEMGYCDFCCNPEKKIGKIRIYISYNTSTLVCHFHVEPNKMLCWKEQIENSPVECIEEMVKDSKERFTFNSAWYKQDELLQFVKIHRNLQRNSRYIFDNNNINEVKKNE